MLADVRRMRRGGRPLPRDEIMASEPLRGDLMIFRRPGDREALPVAALLGEDLMTYQLPPLDQARVLRWRGRQLVLVGLEEAGSRKAPRVVMQAWWVQLVAVPG